MKIFGKTSLVYLKFASLAVLPMVVVLFVFSTYWTRLTVEDLEATHNRDVAQTISMFEDIIVSIINTETPPSKLREDLSLVVQAFAKKPGVSCVQLLTEKSKISYPPPAFCKNMNFRDRVEVSIEPKSSYTFFLNSKYLDEIISRAKWNTHLFVIISSVFLVFFTSIGLALSYSGRFKEIMHLNEIMFEQNPLPTAHIDADFRILGFSQSWVSTFEKATAGQLKDIFDDATLHKLSNEIQSMQIEEIDELELEISLNTFGMDAKAFIAKIVIADANRTSFYISLVNINDKLKELDLRKQQALNDNLTGCYTRTALLEKFSEGIYKAGTEFVMIDIDDFKSVNDLYGHDIGDQFLTAFVQRTGEIFSNSHDLFRLGGEEFLLVEKKPNCSIDLDQRINILSLSEISTNQDVVLRSVSAGVSSLKFNDRLSDILSRCDQALMSAKTSGKNQVVKFSSVIEKSRINFSDRDFQNAVEKNELTYHFQPIFCSRRQRFAGVEGLIRWNTDKSLLLPDQFYEAFSQYLTKTHQRSYQHNLFVTSLSECSIDDMQFVTYNISKADFLEVGFNHLLKELTPLLSKTDVVLELSENMIFEGVGNNHYPQMIEELKAKGFKLALDDFGKDLSNLNRLIEIDVDLVKLDRSLIKNCSVDPKKLKILSSFSRLFSELNIKVIAEGMETLGEAQELSKIGINLHQGYFYSRPVAASSVDQGYLLKIFEQNYEEQSNV